MSEYNRQSHGRQVCYKCPNRVVTEDGKICEKNCERRQKEIADGNFIKAEKVKDNRQIREYYRTHRKKQV